MPCGSSIPAFLLGALADRGADRAAFAAARRRARRCRSPPCACCSKIAGRARSQPPPAARPAAAGRASRRAAAARRGVRAAVSSPAPRRRRTMRIVAIDRSFSMGGPGAFRRARATLAREAVDERPGWRGSRVIAFDDRADVVAPPGTAAAARAALGGGSSGLRRHEYRALLAKAAEVAGASAARLVIVSDLQRAGWDNEGHAVLPSNVAVDLRDRGGPPMRNVAVAAVRPAADRVVASVRNAGSRDPKRPGTDCSVMDRRSPATRVCGTTGDERGRSDRGTGHPGTARSRCR